MQSILGCCCEVLYLMDSSFHLWSAVPQFPILLQMHLFLSIEVFFHCVFMQMSSFMNAFALLNNFWLLSFQIHSVFIDVSYLVAHIP